jgi:ribonuclease J
MPTITVYDGANTIGGNKILLEDRDTAVFLDFGMSFAARSLYFEEFLMPRSRTGLLDPIHMGLIPPLRGIYRADMEDPAGRVWERAQRSPHYRKVRAEAVLLSHAHMDHCGYISFLDTDVPIVSTAMTAYLAKAIQDCGANQFESEMAYATPKISDKEGGLRGAPPKDFPYERRPYLLTDHPPMIGENSGTSRRPRREDATSRRKGSRPPIARETCMCATSPWTIPSTVQRRWR